MDRRQLGLALAGGAFGLAAPALTTPAMAQPRRGGMGGAERQHAMNTALTGTVSLRSSELALQRARSPEVRRFAEMEADEQRDISRLLREITGMPPPPLGPREQRMVADLENQRGPGFERAYLDAQRMGHEELLRIQDTYLASGARDMNHKILASLARGRIREHISDISQLMRMG